MRDQSAPSEKQAGQRRMLLGGTKLRRQLREPQPPPISNLCEHKIISLLKNSHCLFH